MIGLCFLTCDRFAYTQRTLETFAQFNRLQDFRLFHADDASEDRRVPALARAYGFRTVVQNRDRRGWLQTRRALFEAAAKTSSWILFVENDIETLRPFPWTLFTYVRKHRSVYCLRLYGRFKDLERRQPCLTTHKRRQHLPVRWRPFRHAPERSSIGDIHWSAQPCVTRRAELIDLHRTGDEPVGLTVRVKKNVMAHIGTMRTPAAAADDCPVSVAAMESVPC